jgi:cytochrome c
MTQRSVSPVLFSIVLGASLASAPAWAAGNAASGEQLFTTKCAVCHTIAAGQPNRIGPNLHGLFDRLAGKAPGFHYTAGLAAATFRWDDQRLDHWLTDPASVVPGTAMVLKTADARQRQDLIAYLRKASK